MCKIHKQMFNNKIIQIILIIWLIKEQTIILSVRGQSALNATAAVAAVGKNQLENIETGLIKIQNLKSFRRKNFDYNSTELKVILKYNKLDDKSTLYPLTNPQQNKANFSKFYAKKSSIFMLEPVTNIVVNKINSLKEKPTTKEPFQITEEVPCTANNKESLSNVRLPYAGGQYANTALKSLQAPALLLYKTPTTFTTSQKHSKANEINFFLTNSSTYLNKQKDAQKFAGYTEHIKENNFIKSNNLINKTNLILLQQRGDTDNKAVSEVIEKGKANQENRPNKEFMQKHIFHTNINQLLNVNDNDKKNVFKHKEKFEKKIKTFKEKFKKEGKLLQNKMETPAEIKTLSFNSKAKLYNQTKASKLQSQEKANILLSNLNKTELFVTTNKLLNKKAQNKTLNETLKHTFNKSSNEEVYNSKTEKPISKIPKNYIKTLEPTKLLELEEMKLEKSFKLLKQTEIILNKKFATDLKNLKQKFLNIKNQVNVKRSQAKESKPSRIQNITNKSSQPNKLFNDKIFEKNLKNFKESKINENSMEENYLKIQQQQHSVLEQKSRNFTFANNNKSIEILTQRQEYEKENPLTTNFKRPKRLNSKKKVKKNVQSFETQNSTEISHKNFQEELENTFDSLSLKQNNETISSATRDSRASVIEMLNKTENKFKNESIELETKGELKLNFTEQQKQLILKANTSSNNNMTNIKNFMNNKQLDGNINKTIQLIHSENHVVNNINRETITPQIITTITTTTAIPTTEKIYLIKALATSADSMPTTAVTKHNLLEFKTALTTTTAALTTSSIQSNLSLIKSLESTNTTNSLTTANGILLTHDFNSSKSNNENKETNILASPSIEHLYSLFTTTQIPINLIRTTFSPDYSLITTSSPASTLTTSAPLWPVKHASVMEGDVILGGLMMVHSREDSITCGPIMPQGGIQALEAMLYTLDQVNKQQLLPNITLGAHILDDCDKDTYGLEMAVDFIKGKF